MAAIPDSLQALLARLIDYAGLYPPAGLPLGDVLQQYEAGLASPEGWMLNRLVLPAGKVAEVRPKPGWRITLLVDREPGALPAAVETLETKAPGRLSLPTYCEAPIERIDGAFAKIRTGGLTADVIPPSAEIADFLVRAAGRKLPFKATAGLHHPFRSPHALTYAADSPHATMHGFINVFVAAAFAWFGMDRSSVVEALEESEPRAFEFRTGELRWHGRTLSTAQIREARASFAHSFGSCSFAEPVDDLRECGLLL